MFKKAPLFSEIYFATLLNPVGCSVGTSEKERIILNPTIFLDEFNENLN
jgi:hypothetical protein